MSKVRRYPDADALGRSAAREVQLIAPESGRLVWLVDRAAAAKLHGEP